jgi:riboflavin synthase
MFTGIVLDVGELRSREERGGDLVVRIAPRQLPLARVAVGDSIAVSGVCLTVTRLEGDAFVADVSRETLALTTFGALAAGAQVNLEPALRAGDALGGHLVSGHVDGVAEVLAIEGDGRSVRVTCAVPLALARYIAPKGSVTLDGVSLTVNGVEGSRFDVNLVPHTCAVTTLGGLTVGRRLNLEVDPIARYVERLLVR